MKKQDTEFHLTSLFDNFVKNSHAYKNANHEIERNGAFVINSGNREFKVYTPELALILISKEIPALYLNTEKETIVNGQEYLKTYIEAYKRGEQYFENEYKTPYTVVTAEQYVIKLHKKYYHEKFKGSSTGWNFVKKQFSRILSYKFIAEFGYNSGIISKVDEQVQEDPNLSAIFNICKHNTSYQQTKDVKLKVPQIALIHYYRGIPITRDNAKEIANEHGYNAKSSGEGLYQDYLKYYIASDRIAKPTAGTKKTLINKIELFESVVPFISETEKKKANDEIEILKTILKTEYP